MSQADYNIDNAPGATVRSDINDQLQAIATNNSGQGEPDPVFPYMVWADTDNGLIKQRNGSNTAWVTIGSLSGSTWIPYRAGTAQGTASTRDVGTGSGANLLDRDQLDGRLMRRSQNGADIDNAGTFRNNISVYSTSQTYSTGQADSEIESRINNRFPISQSQMASNSVGQSQLKTATGTNSDSGTTTNVAVPGGRWAFNPGVSTGGSPPSWHGSSSLETPRLRSTSSPSTHTLSVRARYMQSSPPYDHGDGKVQGYFYGALNASGALVSSYIAEDPPWYGNTQQTPIEQWRDPETGKEYQRSRRLKCCKRDVDEGRISLAEFIAKAGECEDVVEEITPETKLRGMEELPHPFDEPPDRTVVLLDPMDPLVGKLIRMMQAGEDVHALFREDYLRVDNTACKRCGPPGVAIHKAKWKHT